MIITISGMPGSGKSVVADKLAEKLGLKRYSIGDFRREVAKRRGVTLQQMNEIAEKEGVMDHEQDNWQRELSEKEDNFIIDGRLSFHFIPDSIKLFLEVSPEEGARRVLQAKRPEEPAQDIDDAVRIWHERVDKDRIRYKKIYGIDCYDTSQYDFVLDTSKLAVEKVVDTLLVYIKDVAVLKAK